MHYILGINAYHPDSSACLLKNGKLLFAAEEERFKRIKHWSGFPYESIKFCLDAEGLTIKDIKFISLNYNSTSSFIKKFFFGLKNSLNSKFIIQKLLEKRIKNNIKKDFYFYFKNDFNGKIFNIEHHMSHIASAYFFSPFENSVLLSLDGFGDFSSSAWGLGVKDKIIIDKRIYFPDSIGIFYQAMTQYLGFFNYGDEYKLMGLASYGKPIFEKDIEKIIDSDHNGIFNLNLKYFLHDKKNINFQFSEGYPVFNNLFSNKLIQYLGPARKKGEKLSNKHIDLACSVQKVYEGILIKILIYLYDKYKIKNLSFAGGCAMNSSANGKIKTHTPFDKIFIQPAAGDAGGAIGSAIYTWHKIFNNKKYLFFKKKKTIPRKNIMKHSYFGPSFSNEEIKTELMKNKFFFEKSKIKYKRIDNFNHLCKLVSKKISSGKIIGWYQDRMEWGPRALGNRSILCDPRNKKIRDILNIKIKKREKFRPFAPSILREKVKEWFEVDDENPFMTKVYKIKDSKKILIPAVCHIDGTGRVQTVRKINNKKYYLLIKEFFKLTGVPILLNTSFNESEPIVCTPKNALDCFIRTNMDIIVLQNWIVYR